MAEEMEQFREEIDLGLWRKEVISQGGPSAIRPAPRAANLHFDRRPVRDTPAVAAWREFRIHDPTPDLDVLNLEDIAGGNLHRLGRERPTHPPSNMGYSTASKHKKFNAEPRFNAGQSFNAGPKFNAGQSYNAGPSFNAGPAFNAKPSRTPAFVDTPLSPPRKKPFQPQTTQVERRPPNPVSLVDPNDFMARAIGQFGANSKPPSGAQVPSTQPARPGISEKKAEEESQDIAAKTVPKLDAPSQTAKDKPAPTTLLAASDVDQRKEQRKPKTTEPDAPRQLHGPPKTVNGHKNVATPPVETEFSKQGVRQNAEPLTAEPLKQHNEGTHQSHSDMGFSTLPINADPQKQKNLEVSREAEAEALKQLNQRLEIHHDNRKLTAQLQKLEAALESKKASKATKVTEDNAEPITNQSQNPKASKAIKVKEGRTEKTSQPQISASPKTTTFTEDEAEKIASSRLIYTRDWLMGFSHNYKLPNVTNCEAQEVFKPSQKTSNVLCSSAGSSASPVSTKSTLSTKVNAVRGGLLQSKYAA